MTRHSLGLATLLIWALCGPLLGQPLSAPENLEVSTDGQVYRGRWQAVSGASYYEVWTRAYGKWRFDEKNHLFSPLTSSFEIPGSDDRTLFKVRAVSADGQKGEFSQECAPTVQTQVNATGARASGAPSSSSDFDPEAPPPEPPGSLFAVWTEPREIRLVWQASARATRYAVEEWKDDRWVSVTNLEFPKDTSALIKDKPMPGPYQFRVRAIGRNGRASEPSRATTVKR